MQNKSPLQILRNAKGKSPEGKDKVSERRGLI